MNDAWNIFYRIIDVEILEMNEDIFAIVDHLGSGVLLAVEDVTIYANKTVANIFGYDDPQEILNLSSYFELVAPSERARIKQYAIDRHEGREAPPEYEFQGVRKDGSPVWILNRPVSILLKGQNTTLATIVDITKRKRTELLLASKNNELEFQKKALDEHAIVSITDVEGKITYANDKFCLISGYSRAEIIGRKHDIVASGDHPPSFFQNMWESISQGITWQGDIKNRNKNGEKYWLHTTIVPNLDRKGRPFQYVGIRTDVTQLRDMVSKIQNTDIFHRNIISTAQQGFWQIDNEKRTVAVNASLCELLGYEETEIIGKTPMDFAPMGRKSLLSGSINRRENLDERTYETVLSKKNGEAIDVLFHATTLREIDGNMAGSFAFLTDITGQKKYEAKLAKATKAAERASRAKSEFLAAMSHEIRTPMAGVLGLTDFLLDSELTSEQLDWATSIRASGTSLLNILNEILDQSKLEAGKLEIVRTDFKLYTLIQEISLLFRSKIREKGLTFSIEIDEQVPDAIHADYTRIGQVLSNLLSNALKFTEIGGVVVKVENTHLDNDKYQIRFTVSDTGIGLEVNARRRIFTPFSQADSSTSRQYGGTGLGLSISKQLAELMGGEIGVESSSGHGASFWFTITCSAAKEKIEEKDHAPQREQWFATRPLNILVVEDSKVNQQIIMAVLDSLDHSATLVENGQLAVEILQVETFDIVLMDIRMPIMDGLEATRLIRSSNEENASIPIIALTADISPENVQEYKTMGMDDVCAKPLILSELFTAINNRLGDEIHFSENKGSLQKMERLDIGGDNAASGFSHFSQVLEYVSKNADACQQDEDSEPFRIIGLEGLDAESMQELATQYEEEAIRQCNELKDAVSLLLEDPLNVQERDKLKDIFHMIKGQGDTFGYQLFAKIANDADTFLKIAGPLKEKDVAVLNNHVDALALIAEQKISYDGGQVGRVLLRGLADFS